MIIGISGKKRHGKNTAALAFKDSGFIEVSFAAPLKRMVSYAIRSSLDKNDNFNRSLKFEEINRLIESINTYHPLTFKNKANIFTKIWFKTFKTVREILQFVGTDVCRKLDNEFFVKIMINKLTPCMGDFVITDVRFEEERRMVTKMAGVNILVFNPRIENTDTHESENSLGNLNLYDITIINDGTIEDLHKKVLNSFDGETHKIGATV